MKDVYTILGISKQAFHQRVDRMLARKEEEGQLLHLVRQIRRDHPKISARKMYQMLSPETMGRDRFELMCFENGYKVKITRNYAITTNSRGVIRFPNLLTGVGELTRVNQVWISDITYYQIKETFYYITFVTDMYSRRILGYTASKSLHTVNTTIPSVKMSLKVRKGEVVGTIIHSDAGGQYYCKEFIRLTEEYGMKNSMAEDVYENPMAERVNGIIKNEYLKPYAPTNFEQLTRLLKKAVELYNYQRPHLALGYLTPVDFEQKNCTLKRINQNCKPSKKVNAIQA